MSNSPKLVRCRGKTTLWTGFQGYLKLAYQYGDAKDIAHVIERVRAAEQELIESPDVEFRFHSGVPA